MGTLFRLNEGPAGIDRATSLIREKTLERIKEAIEAKQSIDVGFERMKVITEIRYENRCGRARRV